MIFQLLGSSIFIIWGVLTIKFAFKTRFDAEKSGKFFLNECLIGVLYILAAILYPFFYIGTGISPETENLMYILTLLIWIAEIGVFGIMILMEKGRCKRNPQLLIDRDYTHIKADYRANFRYDIKKDIKRKALHMLAVGVIALCWVLGQVLGVLSIVPFGMTPLAFYKWGCVTIGLAFVIMFAMGDLVRLNKFAYLPPWASKWFMSSIILDELVTYISSAPLVLGFVPFLFAPFQLFLAVALISSLADAAASIIGKRYGKHHLSTTSKKTFEGLFAGGFAAFLIVAIAMATIMGSGSTVTPVTVFSMAGLAAVLFMAVDIFIQKLSDNITNSLVCGAGMVLVFLFVI